MEEPKIKRVGNIGGVNTQSRSVYTTDGISPTLTARAEKGNTIPYVVQKEQVICAMRGRNPDNPSDRTPGIELEQTLEINSEGIANTLTTVQKDNLVLESGSIPLNPMEDGTCRCLKNQYGKNSIPNFESQGTWGGTGVVHVKQATTDGIIPCRIGGVADLNYPDSKTRRGRVIENGEVCPTLTTENIPSVLEDWIWEVDGQKYLIRIRKLTPRECWRLMDFTDEDFDKAQAVNSNTQLYKQAGNSIVKNVLCEVFKQLIGE